MKSFYQYSKHCLFLLTIIIICTTAGQVNAQNPLERKVAENGPAQISFDLVDARVISSDFDEYVSDYVEFIYDSGVSSRIKQEMPKTISVSVPTARGAYNLRLVETKVTRSDYRVEVSAGEVVYTKPLGVHYHGIVEGHAGSIASASFFDGEMSILASTRELGNFTVNKTDENGRYISYFDRDMYEYPAFTCGTEEPDEIPEFLQDQRMMQSIWANRGGDPCVGLHVEADYNLFQNKGNSVENTVEYIEGIMSQVKLVYELESINLLLSYLNVWDTPDPFEGGDPLGAFGSWLRTGQGILNGDFGQLIAFDGSGYGVSNGIGNDACFSDHIKIQYSSIDPSYSDFPNFSWTINVVGHELGHCIASYHTHACVWNGDFSAIDNCGPSCFGTGEGDNCISFPPILPPEGGTVMSYCHGCAVGINLSLGFGPQPGDALRAALAATTCLADCPAGDCVPPGNLRLDAVSSTEATISWYHGSETDFEVTYGYDGNFISMDVIGASSVTLTDLDQGKNYDFSVATLCSDSQSYGVDGVFKTVCNAVYSLPYLELFEGDGWEAESYRLEGCWTGTITDEFYGWTVLDDETPSSNTGPLGDHTSGIGKYVYAEATFGSDGDVSYLVSPQIDLGSVIAPFIRFYYHMYGATVGSLELQIKRESLPINVWFTLTTLAGQQQESNSDPWSEVLVDLSEYEGELIRLRFAATRGADYQGDIAIDDLVITDETLVDVAVTGITSPVTGCGLGSAEQVIVTVENTGFQTLVAGTEIALQLELDGSPVTSETLTLAADLEAGQFVAYEFAQALDISEVGVYEVSVTTSLDEDEVPANDIRVLKVINRANISVFPYTESFENGSNWNAGTDDEGGPMTWALGTPNKTIINGASDGENAWVTGGLGPDFYSDDESSYVESPCFDFSNLLDPVLTLDVWWDIEDGWEGARMQYSIDLGDTWQTIGMEGPDWYNYSNIYNGEGDDAWSGSPNHSGDPGFFLPNADGSGGWVTVTHALEGLSEAPSVLLRMWLLTDPAVTAEGIAFDNVRITGTSIEPPCYEMNFSATTCDPDEAGQEVVVLQDVSGCDSIVTVNTTLLESYDILIQDYSCDPADTGSIVTVYTAQTTCDSVVTERTDLWPSYAYGITVESCDPGEVGIVVVDGFTVNGCDSTVEITTVLKDPYAVMVMLSSCNPADTGTVEEMLLASDGCDSVVTTVTQLSPIEADFTWVENEGVVTFTNTSANAAAYAWSFGDGNTNDVDNPTNTYTVSGDYTVTLIASTPGCESDTHTVVIEISIISGIDLISFIELVNVFPNPNDGNFVVELKGAAVFEDLQFTLFNAAGRKVETRDVPFNSYARETYNMNDLPNGIYFLRIRSDEEQTTFKINVLR
jgi:hypothetical protein